MAVAAYASVLSLLRVVDNVQHPSHLRFFPDTSQIDALREKLCSLQKFFEDHSSTITKDIECMARKIPKITYDAEILIDNYAVDQLYRDLCPQYVLACNIGSFYDETHRVIQEIAPINEALKTMTTTQHDREQPSVLNKITSNKPLKNKMVGFDDQLKEVLEKLIGNQPNLVVIPIVGMGGIGKTTLARSLLDHPYNLDHFDVRIWLTVSLDYSVEKVLQGLFKDGVLSDKKYKEGDESETDLITRLYKKLYGKRYLIVLDDVWSLDAWYDLKRGFPNNKGSRVIVTTRLSDIANNLDSLNDSYSMKFLDEYKSWDLFSEIAFAQGGRSLKLEEIGREISKLCKGLPLLLASIGGLLSSSNMKAEHWQTVKEDINSFVNSANDEYCLRILSLSYNHLPIHLKPCFLHMRHSEEDSDIDVSRLIETWVSHGFVKPMEGKSLEEAAREYLEDLIGRNMFLIRKRCVNGNIKFCGIHDLLRDLCIKESSNEQLLELPERISVYGFGEVCVVCNERKTGMVALYSGIFGSGYDGKLFVCFSCESIFPQFARSKFVMALSIGSRNVPLLTKCRWVALHPYDTINIFSTIRLIWNLEILNIGFRHYIDLRKEIWEMPRLRQLKALGSRLPDPVNDVIVLENMHTLEMIKQLKFTERIVRRIPNLRKLWVWYEDDIFSMDDDWPCYHLRNLADLKKLESLAIRCTVHDYLPFNVIAFPCSLKKLSLKGSKIAWDDLTVIGALPNLEVLKLFHRSVIGEEWNPIEEEFPRLKYLKLVGLNLVHWRVDGTTHFPALETLFVGDMHLMEAIPQEIGELPSLTSIYLEKCHESIIDSARAIVEEQVSNGNERLAVHVKDGHVLV